MSTTIIRKLSASESVRKFCVSCMGGSYVLVSECPDTACPLHAYRLGPAPEQTRPPVRAIRRQCLACCCGGRDRVRACAASPTCKEPYEPCWLWRYRLGSRPEIFERRKRKAKRTLLTLPGLSLDKPAGSPAA
ncbi:restriction endonuclease [Fundidesulfovibrio terrae]|uniref:restriction endonuclease n=1 Tax=Fundidesulfovibrio terrae TaxID=2922866 RepID=UPI001FB02ECF|nr:restriction endonuclease [Fundidesulfovibrio terrae]